jgi:hypothetical protein
MSLFFLSSKLSKAIFSSVRGMSYAKYWPVNAMGVTNFSLYQYRGKIIITTLGYLLCYFLESTGTSGPTASQQPLPENYLFHKLSNLTSDIINIHFDPKPLFQVYEDAVVTEQWLTAAFVRIPPEHFTQDSRIFGSVKSDVSFGVQLSQYMSVLEVIQESFIELLDHRKALFRRLEMGFESLLHSMALFARYEIFEQSNGGVAEPQSHYQLRTKYWEALQYQYAALKQQILDIRRTHKALRKWASTGDNNLRDMEEFLQSCYYHYSEAVYNREVAGTHLWFWERVYRYWTAY